MTPRTETNRIFLHCTATPEGMEVTKDMLYQWHVVDNGWSDIGYHWLVHLDGTWEACRDEELMGAGCSGENEDTIHVSYAGGVASDGKTAKDTRTPEQKEAIIALLKDIKTRYPHLTSDSVVGHNQYAAKACPSFDVPTEVAAYLASKPPEMGSAEPGMPEQPPLGMALDIAMQQIDALMAKIEDLEGRIAVLEGGK